jgi:hypothetical protein
MQVMSSFSARVALQVTTPPWSWLLARIGPAARRLQPTTAMANQQSNAHYRHTAAADTCVDYMYDLWVYAIGNASNAVSAGG